MTQKTKIPKYVKKGFIRDDKTQLISDLDSLIIDLQVMKRGIQKNNIVELGNLSIFETTVKETNTRWENKLRDYVEENYIKETK